MSDGFAITVVSLLFAVFGIVVGFHLGDEAGARCENTARYATANVVAILVGSLLFMVVWATGYVVLGMFAFGAVAGGEHFITFALEVVADEFEDVVFVVDEEVRGPPPDARRPPARPRACSREEGRRQARQDRRRRARAHERDGRARGQAGQECRGQVTQCRT